MSPYVRFFSMIITSTVVMFLLTYVNTYQSKHIFFSEARVYMSLIMGAAMAVIMLTFMLPMHKNKVMNTSIYVSSVLCFCAGLVLVRSQTTVQDVSYMKAMIPHHSIAILTSERASISDLRARELADKIIMAQRKEIKEMQWLINDISTNGEAKTPIELERRNVPDFEGSL